MVLPPVARDPCLAQRGAAAVGQQRRRLRLVVSCLGGIVMLTAAAGTREFYVATDGRDSNSGTRRRPFATLEAARDAIRALKRDQRLAAGATVWLRGGRYHLGRTFELTAEDSGTPQGPILYAAFPGERPVLSGGRPITGWAVADDGRWQTQVPAVKAGEWYFRQLFVNGGWRQRPRLPRDGTFSVAGGAAPETSAFRFRPGDLLEAWCQQRDIEFVVQQYWTEARLFPAGLDLDEQVVRFTGGSWRPLTWSNGYFVENVREALGQPGQWYLERESGLLSYLPLTGETIAGLDVVAPVLEQLVVLRGEVDRGAVVEHITFRGLALMHTAWQLPPTGLAYPQGELAVKALFAAEGAAHCSVEACEVALADSWGLEFGRGCQANRVVGNRLRDLGAGGIRVGEDTYLLVSGEGAQRRISGCKSQKELAGDCEIADNLLCDGARSYFGGPGIWIGQSGGNRIVHNEVSGGWQFGISVGWNWGLAPSPVRDNLVEANHVHHVGGVLGSHSSIYTLGIQPGTVIRGNHVHHGVGYGIALDQASSGIVVENNLVHDQRAGALHFNWDCLGNWVHNNIFALNGSTGQWTRYGDAPQAEDVNSNILMQNIIYWDGGPLLHETKWADFRMVMDFNLYFDASGQPVLPLGLSWAAWRGKRVASGLLLDFHSVVADPLFVDLAGRDFRLQPESPVLALGFREFEVSKAGPRLRPGPEAPEGHGPAGPRRAQSGSR